MKKSIFLLLISIVSTNVMADNRFLGTYAGVSLGYVDGLDKGKEFEDGVFNDYTQKNSPAGALLGIFAGVNWSLNNNILLGIEADYDVRNADDKNFQKEAGVTDTLYPVKTDLKSAASIRARLGYLLNKNQSMVYITAGYAAAKVSRRFFDLEAPDSQSSSEWHDGWTAGIGVEHSFMKNLTFRAEYRYSDYGNETFSTSPLFGDDYIEKQSYEEDTIRASIVYYF